MSPDLACQIIHNELLLDGNARTNVATFVSTWMDPQAEKLMAECFDKNMIDKDEYPHTAEIEMRCANILADLRHAPAVDAATGGSTTGSSEAAIFGGPPSNGAGRSGAPPRASLPTRRGRPSLTERQEKGTTMCRWLAYFGTPALIETLLYKPQHSLIDQSLHSQLGAETTNGDGFGIGWYGVGDTPGVFHSIEPAWNDRNLRDIAGHIRSPLVFAHIRASSGSPVQQTNCHPFRYGRWLWMHNGLIRDFHHVKRELVLAVDPSLYPSIEGSTDSETFFFLALTFGLEDDPPAAVERAVGFIEHVGRSHGVEHPIQMTVATTDGRRIWAFRYSSERQSRSLFYSTDVPTLRKIHPDLEVLQVVDDESRLVVSEPLRDLAGVWNEVPESSYGVVQPGEDELRPFTPRPPG
jgi:glutamine amidotransferase